VRVGKIAFSEAEFLRLPLLDLVCFFLGTGVIQVILPDRAKIVNSKKGFVNSGRCFVRQVWKLILGICRGC